MKLAIGLILFFVLLALAGGVFEGLTDGARLVLVMIVAGYLIRMRF